MVVVKVPDSIVKWWERLVRGLVAVIISLATGGLLLGYFGVYYPTTVVPVGVALTALILWLWQSVSPVVVDPEDNGLAMIVGLLTVVACVLLHAKFSGNFIFIHRDPAFYNLVGLDLARTGDLAFDGVASSLSSVGDLRVAAQGVVPSVDGTELYAQGFHGHEAVTAPVEWIGGLGLFLKATSLLGGVVLVTLRRVAVRVSSPWIATVLTGALGASLPFAEFTRNPYSEVLVLACVLGALLVLLEGPVNARRLLVTGVVAGTAMTARIDSLLVISGFAAAMLLVPVLVEHRWARWSEVLAVAVGTAPPVAIGLFVGYRRSPKYADDLSGSMQAQVLLVAAVLAGVAFVYLLRLLIHRVRVDTRRLSSRPLATLAALATLSVGFLYWFVAPHVLELHAEKYGLLRRLQEREGVPVDVTRSYGEQALPRLEMNYGTVLLAVAIAGAALVVYRAIRQRDRAGWLLLIVGLPSLPYLVMNTITPDMPWAMRRFLPVIIPFMILLGAVALERLRRAMDRPGMGFAVALAIVFAGPAAALLPTATVRGDATALGFTEAICREIPAQTSTVLVSHGWLAATGLQTIEQICDVDAVSGPLAGSRISVAVEVSEALDDEDGPLVFIMNVDEKIPTEFVEESRTTLRGELEFVQPTVEKQPDTKATDVRAVDVVVVSTAG